MQKALRPGGFCLFSLEDLNQQAAFACAESVDPNGEIIVVAENKIQLGVANGSVLMHGQIFGAARAVRTESCRTALYRVELLWQVPPP